MDFRHFCVMSEIRTLVWISDTKMFQFQTFTVFEIKCKIIKTLIIKFYFKPIFISKNKSSFLSNNSAY